MNDKTELLKKLSSLGLPMMEVSDDVDVSQTLAEVVESRDPRLWEAFPVLLLNASKNYGYDYLKVYQLLADQTEKDSYRALLVLSVAFYDYHHLKYHWVKKLKEDFTDAEQEQTKSLKAALGHAASFNFAGMTFDSARLKTMFNRYYESDAGKNQKKRENLDALSVEYALSQFFSPKQKDLFKKKLDGELLTKTEKEYFSRVVKKKVMALANQDLHRMALKLVEMM
jgi:hypothetical protein